MIAKRFPMRRHFRRSGFAGAVVAGLLAAQTLGAASACAADMARQAETQADAPASGQTLAAALAEARVPEGSAIALSVDAEGVPLPKTHLDGSPEEMTPLPAGVSVARVADRFGQLDRTVGAVLAVAPRTMVAINTKLDKPNVYIGMPPNDVLTLLLATLTSAQWQEVTGEQGLALSSLHTDDQVMLIKALLPKGALTVAPWYSSRFINYKPEDVQDLSGSLPEARLRLSQSYGVLYPARENSGIKYSSSDIPPADDGMPHYRISERWENFGDKADSLFGVPVRATVPNVEKASQLPMSDTRLSKGVVPTGCKTVGDLITRIATTTGVELYADPHYAALPLTVVTRGTTPVAVTARDLLRAVALCATATYRRVGAATEVHPAYVLTDDLVGMGTRQSLWYEFEMDGDALRTGPVWQASQTLYRRFGALSVKPIGDDAALTPPADTKTAASSSLSHPDSPPSLYKPYSALTAAEQAAVQRVVDDHNKAYTTSPAVAEGNIEFYPVVRTELLLSSLPAPIDMNVPVNNNLLFSVPTEVLAQRKVEADARVQARSRQYLADHPEEAKKVPVPPKPLVPHRAVLLSPASAAEVTQDIDAMQRLNLNELWIAMPFPSRTAADSDSAEAILKAAIRAAQPVGIRVFPLLTPLADFDASSGKVAGKAADRDAATAIRDSNILGETSAEAERHVQERSVMLHTDSHVLHRGEEEERPIPPVFDNSLALGVLADAQAQLKRLAALNPPVAGVVLQETSPPGYTPVRGGDDMNRRQLGYNEAMRLAFLRRFHADPVDLYTPNYYGKADTRVPIQKLPYSGNPYKDWLRFRVEQNAVFLHDLLPAAGTLPLLIQQSDTTRLNTTFVSVDDPTQPLPLLSDPGKVAQTGDPDSIALPRQPGSPQIKLSVIPVSGFMYLRGYAYPPADGVRERSPSNGFVLDFTATNRYFNGHEKDQEPLPTTLPALADYVARHTTVY